MDSYTSMKNKLQPLGLYSFESGTNVSNELYACAEGLDFLFDMLDEMTRECFIPTSMTYGLSQREILSGGSSVMIPYLKRREMLLDKEVSYQNGCSVSAFEKMLSGYGLYNFTITENFSGQEVIIKITDSLTDEMKSIVTDKINADFPTHLTITINFSPE